MVCGWVGEGALIIQRDRYDSQCQDHHNPAKPPQCKGSPSYQGTRQVWVCAKGDGAVCGALDSNPPNPQRCGVVGRDTVESRRVKKNQG